MICNKTIDTIIMKLKNKSDGLDENLTSNLIDCNENTCDKRQNETTTTIDFLCAFGKTESIDSLNNSNDQIDEFFKTYAYTEGLNLNIDDNSNMKCDFVKRDNESDRERIRRLRENPEYRKKEREQQREYKRRYRENLRNSQSIRKQNNNNNSTISCTKAQQQSQQQCIDITDLNDLNANSYLGIHINENTNEQCSNVANNKKENIYDKQELRRIRDREYKRRLRTLEHYRRQENEKERERKRRLRENEAYRMKEREQQREYQRKLRSNEEYRKKERQNNLWRRKMYSEQKKLLGTLLDC